MTTTAHGHHIDGTPTLDENPERKIQRCGGPGLCASCSREAERWRVRNDGTIELPKQTPILRYFAADHLPPILAVVAGSFRELALEIDLNIPDGAEKSVALRKLLEAKDAAVRASLDLV